jgi:hypothetical protein
MSIQATQIFLGSTPIPFYYVGEDQVGLYPETQTSIPTNGLIYLFDATNVNSYPGSGSQWNDLSPNKIVASIFSSSVFPTWDNTNKEFDFNGSNQALIANISSSAFTGSIIRDFSQLMWMKMPTSGISPQGVLGVVNMQTATPGGTTFDAISFVSGSNNWRLQSNENFRNVNAPAETVFNEYFLISATRTSGTDNFKLYKNTTVIASASMTPVTYAASGSTPIWSSIGQRFYNTGNASWPSDGWWSGSLSSVMLYNRVLSDIEIAQIFNAGRTGISI